MCRNIYHNCITKIFKIKTSLDSLCALTIIKPRKKRKKNMAKHLCTQLIIFSAIIMFAVMSCSDTPSLADIEQLNDRTPPFFSIEEPANGDIYGDNVIVKGVIIDNMEYENQVQRIDSATYRIDGNGEGFEIPMEDDGSFRIAFSTYHLDGDLSIVLEAVDTSGNKGTILLSLIDAPQPTNEPEPTETPDSTPTPVPDEYPPGTCWFEPENVSISRGQSFLTELHINSGDQVIVAYNIAINYSFSFLELDFSAGNSGVKAGPDGYISAVNSSANGLIAISGFDTSGTGPGLDLHFLTFYWKAHDQGNTFISIMVGDLIDNSYEDIGVPAGIDCNVTIYTIIREILVF